MVIQAKMVKIRILLAVILVLRQIEIYCEKFGYKDRFTCHCAYNGRCDKTTGVCSPRGCQKGWSGPSCQRQNVAFKKPASQSSYFRRPYPGVNESVMSGYAVDGDVSHGRDLGLYSGQSKCVNMYNENNIGWWSVDLQQTYHLHTIMIYHRDGYVYTFTGASVYITDEHGGSTMCYQNTDEPTSSEVTIQCNGTGRYLNFTQSTGRHTLNLCEVEVYVCSDGTFGSNCSSFCHCEGNGRCDEVSGYCPGRCSPGWTGSSCNQKCETGFYGEDCKSNCTDRKCLNMTSSCDHVTGQCTGGCIEEYYSMDCSIFIEKIATTSEYSFITGTVAITVAITAAVTVAVGLVIIGLSTTVILLHRRSGNKHVYTTPETRELEVTYDVIPPSTNQGAVDKPETEELEFMYEEIPPLK